jgi:MFS family permease
MMGMFFYLTQFLQSILGYTPIQTGLAFLPITVALFVMARVSAGLMGRVGMRTLMVVGLTLSTTGLLLLSRLAADSSYLGVVVPLVFFGLGNGLAFVPLTAAGLTDVAPSEAGAASGLVNVAQQIGGSLGLAILVTIGSGAASHAAAVGANAQAIAAHAFVVGADRAFLASALFLAATVLLLAFTIPAGRAERATHAARVEAREAAEREAERGSEVDAVLAG